LNERRYKVNLKGFRLNGAMLINENTMDSLKRHSQKFKSDMPSSEEGGLIQLRSLKTRKFISNMNGNVSLLDELSQNSDNIGFRAR
jgi:hypothetical protein